MRAMFMRESRPGNLAMPDTVDEFFYHELWFVRNELSVVGKPANISCLLT